MGVREPRIPLRYLQIDPVASRHEVFDKNRIAFFGCFFPSLMMLFLHLKLLLILTLEVGWLHLLYSSMRLRDELVSCSVRLDYGGSWVQYNTMQCNAMQCNTIILLTLPKGYS